MNTASLIIQLPILLFSVILHEYAHGWMAEKHGDDTARVMGRLTFNPVPHIDIFGTILLPLFSVIAGTPVFGWAKPVPVNPYRLNDPQKDMIWVSLAGPLSNFLLAIIAAFGMWFMRMGASAIPPAILAPLYDLLRLILFINVILPVFNLFPIPPLDGSKVLMGLLPPELAYRYSQIEPYGFIIIIMLLGTGILWTILGPVVSIILRLLGGGAVYF